MFKTKEEIKDWLHAYNVKKYTINDDLTVDVDEEVCLINVNIEFGLLSEIPVQFNIVNGNFLCLTNKLITLKGCPNVVNGNFNCSFNNLTSLQYCPNKISGEFICHNNQLTSLKCITKIVYGKLDCHNNFLNSLDHLPVIIGGTLICDYNLKQTKEYKTWYLTQALRK